MQKNEYNLNLMKILNDSISYFEKNYLELQNKSKKKISSNANNYKSTIQGSIHIYSHFDTDGLTAASILAKAFNREKIGYQITILKQLEEQYFVEIQNNNTNKNLLIFCDFGSGQLYHFNKYLLDYNFIILDHHEILKINENKSQINGFHVNPYLANVNGSKEISGAGVAYLFSLCLNPKNKDLAYLAIIGAIGDLQNSGPQKELIGENKMILQDALDEKIIEIEVLPAISRSKSLAYALAYTLPVDIDELRHDLEKTNNILKKIGIKTKTDLGSDRTLADLSDIEKKKLTSELVQLSIKNGNSDLSTLDKILGTNYLIKIFEEYPSIYEARDFSMLLNACGRLNKPSLGLAACINSSRPILLKAIEISEEYGKILKNCISWVKNENRLVSLNEIQYFYGENVIHENIIGVICTSLVFSNELSSNKPVIGYADSDDDYFKVSARCTNNLVKKGVNLSIAIRKVCEKIEIDERGGGHPPASGARVPSNKISKFLDILDKEIENQLKESRKDYASITDFVL